jgi:hypothetical protein
MDINVAEQVLEELLPSLEALETQSTAILQFLKDKGIATDEQLGPYLDRAGNASNVRWLAAGIRIKSILSSAMQNAEQASAKSAERGAVGEKTHNQQMNRPESEHFEKDEPKMARQEETTPSNSAEAKPQAEEADRKEAEPERPKKKDAA